MLKRALTFAAVAIAAASLNGCVIIPMGGFAPPTFQEVELQTGSSWRKILVLDVDGAITSGPKQSGFWSSDSTVVDVTEKLRKAEEDDSIKAVLLRVDSPGGGVTASDVIYRELLKFKEKTGKPIYVSMLDLCASGGYYISMAADEVYASPTTVTGSIGVITTLPQISGLSDKIGVSMEVIKSGKNKDMGAMWHKMTPEERDLFQGIIDDMYNSFVGVVAKNRTKLSEERIRELADGRVYTAKQAHEAGLVDGIMYLDEVIDHIAKKQNLKDPKVIIYRTIASQKLDSIYAKAPATATPTATAGAPTVNMVNVNLHQAMDAKDEYFEYLWVP